MIEYLCYYLIAALSFSIMYAINYNRDTIWSVQKVCDIFDIPMHDHFSPITFYIVSLIFVFILFPAYLLAVLSENKYDIVKVQASAILKEHFGLSKDDY